MRDVNEPIRVAYAAALTTVGIPVYYQYLPNNLNPDNYIVYRSITGNDVSTKSSSDVSLNIVVEIHTKGDVGNQGLTADTIADQVYQLIYPNKQTNLALSRGQVLQTEMANDRVIDFQQKNQFGYISRFITFRHWIFCEGSTGGSTGLTTQGQIFRLEYTGVGGEVGFTDSNLIGKVILDVSKDGISCSQIITSGTPVNKEAKYTTATGAIEFAMAIEPDEEIFVLYQLDNPFAILRFEYTAVGGELSFTDTSLIGMNIVGVSRDGVNASNIISSGTVVDKEAKYETTTGQISFAIALEPNEEVIILYQL